MHISHQERRSIRPRTLVSGNSASFFSFLHFVHIFFIGHLYYLLVSLLSNTLGLDSLGGIVAGPVSWRVRDSCPDKMKGDIEITDVEVH